jgi:hypothetical protein
MVFIDPEKENRTSKKSCMNCFNLTDHKYVESYEKIIPDYRPYSGKRRLTPREAREICECWKCEDCGRYTNYNYEMIYKERKRKELTK